MKVLVTGGAGFLGSHVSVKLLNKGYKVRVIDKLLFGDSGIKDLYKNSDFELQKADITDTLALDNALDGIDFVIHLAAVVGEPACSVFPDVTFNVNYETTKVLADKCREKGIKKFIFVSTCANYGDSKKVLNEKSILKPHGSYAESKVMAENYLLKLKDRNFSISILRLSTLCGLSSRMKFDLAVNAMTARSFFEKKIWIYGDGKQKRAFLNVSDAADILLKVLESFSGKSSVEIFNVGFDENYSRVIDLAEEIKKLLPDSEIIFTKGKSSPDYNVSFAKLKDCFKMNPKYTINDTIRQLIKEYNKGFFNDWKNEKYNSIIKE